MKIAKIIVNGLLIAALANITLVTNNYLNNSPIESSNKLFNNQFGYLNDSDWITNQSIADNKYYSYDTSHANYALSDGSNARNVFMVNDQGMLILNLIYHYPMLIKIIWTILNIKSYIIVK